MKKSITFILLLIFIACKTTVPNKKDIDVKKNINVKTNLLDIVKETVKPEKVITSLISIKKEACAGDCPEFEASITKDSLLNYNGIKNVAILGKHQLKLSSEQFLKLKKALKEAGKNNFSTSYIDNSKSFLPVTNISIDNTTIKINLWKDAPETLTNLYILIEDLLYEQKYLEE